MSRRGRFRKEKLIETSVCNKALKRHGVPNLPVKLVLGANNGWPDRIFFLGAGRILFIEFKDPDEGEVAPIQEYIHELLRGLGYDVQIHDNEDEALQAIRAAQMDAA